MFYFITNLGYVLIKETFNAVDFKCFLTTYPLTISLILKLNIVCLLCSLSALLLCPVTHSLFPAVFGCTFFIYYSYSNNIQILCKLLLFETILQSMEPKWLQYVKCEFWLIIIEYIYVHMLLGEQKVCVV